MINLDVPVEHYAHRIGEPYPWDPAWYGPAPDYNPRPEKLLLPADEERALRLGIEREQVRPSGQQLKTRPTIMPGTLTRLARRGHMTVYLVNQPIPRSRGGQGHTPTPVVSYGVITDRGRARLAGHVIAAMVRNPPMTQTMPYARPYPDEVCT